jgi:hypothetical protein
MHAPCFANYVHIALVTGMTFREGVHVDNILITLCLFPASLFCAIPQHRIFKHFQPVLLPYVSRLYKQRAKLQEHTFHSSCFYVVDWIHDVNTKF